MTTAAPTVTAPAAVIAQVYEAFGRGDLPGLLAFVHPEVAWCQATAGTAHPVLDAGRGTGHAAVGAYFGAVAQHRAITSFAPRVIAASGETVVSVIDLTFSDPAVGVPVSITEAHVFTVVDGLITRYEPIVDTAATAAAFAR